MTRTNWEVEAKYQRQQKSTAVIVVLLFFAGMMLFLTYSIELNKKTHNSFIIANPPTELAGKIGNISMKEVCKAMDCSFYSARWVGCSDECYDSWRESLHTNENATVIEREFQECRANCDNDYCQPTNCYQEPEMECVNYELKMPCYITPMMNFTKTSNLCGKVCTKYQMKVEVSP